MCVCGGGGAGGGGDGMMFWQRGLTFTFLIGDTVNVNVTPLNSLANR